MTLWFFIALMTAAAVFAVLWPLGRRGALSSGPLSASGTDVLIYRDQLEEIARDQSAGRLGAAEAEAARVEVSRRLLAADERAQSEEAARRAPPVWHRRAVALVALLLLPAGATILYLSLGSPNLPGQPLAARMQEKGAPSLARMVAQIEDHLQRQPDDGRGWEVIAPIYVRLGRYDDGVTAWRNAIRYSGATAEREADLGEAIVASANGVVTADAREAFQRAVDHDKSAAKARYFLGLAAVQDGKTEDGVAIWKALLADAPPDAPWASYVREALAQTTGSPPPPATQDKTAQDKTASTPDAGAPSSAAPGPSQSDMAAASEMSPEQRKAMIEGMVERLAKRLKSEGGDFESWLRLVRAYGILGDKDKARTAAVEARRVAGTDHDKTQKLAALEQQLGIATETTQ
jgi:cytochrome c-type biogenesis protein CcmH